MSTLKRLYSLGQVSVDEFLEAMSSIEEVGATSLYVIDLRASKSLEGALRASNSACRVWFNIPLAAVEHITPLGIGCANDPTRVLVSIGFREEFKTLSETFRALTALSAGSSAATAVSSETFGVHPAEVFDGAVGANEAGGLPHGGEPFEPSHLAFSDLPPEVASLRGKTHMLENEGTASGLEASAKALGQFNGRLLYGPVAAFILGVASQPVALIHRSTPTNIGSGAAYFRGKGKRDHDPITVVGELSSFGARPTIFFITGS